MKVLEGTFMPNENDFKYSHAKVKIGLKRLEKERFKQIAVDVKNIGNLRESLKVSLLYFLNNKGSTVIYLLI